MLACFSTKKSEKNLTLIECSSKHLSMTRTQTPIGKRECSKKEFDLTRYFWTSDVTSTLFFFWKKVLNDVIILKAYLIKVSLSGISGYHLGHLDYFGKFSSGLDDELKFYRHFNFHVLKKTHCFSELLKAPLCCS